MKAIFKSTLILITLATILQSCSKENLFAIRGDGPKVSQTFQLQDISGIDMEIDANVIIEYGEIQSITIEAQQNIIDNLETKVRSGTWHIENKHRVKKHDGITIYITMPEINDIDISGSGDVTSTTTMPGENVDIKISGSGNIQMDLEANTVNVDISGSGDLDLNLETNSFDTKISGSGDLTVRGNASEIDINISGSGNIDALDCSSKNSKVKISGSGDVYLDSSDKIDVSISGSGNIYYKQSPVITSNISGSGDLVRVN